MNNQANEAMTILRQLLYIMKVNSVKESGNSEDDVFAGSKVLAEKAIKQKDINIKQQSAKTLSKQSDSLTKMSKSLDLILKELKTQSKTLETAASASGGIGTDELLMMQAMQGLGGGGGKTGGAKPKGKAGALRGMLGKLKGARIGGIAGLATLLGGGAIAASQLPDVPDSSDVESKNKQTQSTIDQTKKDVSRASEQASKQADTLVKSSDDALKTSSSISGKLKNIGKASGKLLGPAAALATVGFLAFDYKDAEQKYQESSKTVDDFVTMKKEQDGAIGGAIGSTAGAALGAAVGSIVPGLGTIIGGAVGGIAGGIIGDFVGEKFAEDSAADEYYQKKKSDDEANRLKELQVAEQSKTTVQTTGDITKQAETTPTTGDSSIPTVTPAMPYAGLPFNMTTIPQLDDTKATSPNTTNPTPMQTNNINDIDRVVDAVSKSHNIDKSILLGHIKKHTDGSFDPKKSKKGGYLNTGYNLTGQSTGEKIKLLANELSQIIGNEKTQNDKIFKLSWWNALNSGVFNDLVDKGFLGAIRNKNSSAGDSDAASATNIFALIPSGNDLHDSTGTQNLNTPLYDRLVKFQDAKYIESADNYFSAIFGSAKSTASEIGGVPVVPHARGAAVVTSATPSIIGEHGPETVIPLDERGANFMGNILKGFMPEGGTSNVDTEVVVDPLIEYFENDFMQKLAQIIMAGIGNMKPATINIPKQEASTTNIINSSNVTTQVQNKQVNIYGV